MHQHPTGACAWNEPVDQARVHGFLSRTRDVLQVPVVVLAHARGHAGPCVVGELVDGADPSVELRDPSGSSLGTLWAPGAAPLALATAASTAEHLLPWPVRHPDRPGAGGPSTALLVAARVLSALSTTATSAGELLPALAAATAPVVDASKVGVAMWSHEQRYLQSLPGSFGADLDLAASSQVSEADQSSGAARAWRTGKPVWTNDPGTQLPGYEDWVTAFGIRQLLTVPLSIAGEPVGVLHLANKPGGFDDRSADAAGRVAPFIAACVATVLREADRRRSEALGQMVSSAATAVLAGDSLDMMAPTILGEFCREAEISMLLVQPSSRSGTAVVVQDGTVDDARRAELVDACHGTGEHIRTHLRRPLRAGDAGSSSVHLPVVVGGRREATLAILRVPGSPFSADEMAAFRRLANIIATASLARAYEAERTRRERVQERRRIADDLHDHVAQTLFSGELVSRVLLEDLDARTADGTWTPDGLRPQLARLGELFVRSQLSLRQAIHQLGDLDTGRTSTSSRLRSTAGVVEEEFGVPVLVVLGAGAEATLSQQPVEIRRVLVKACRELMVNAARHGAAQEISLAVHLDDQRIVAVVTDDGVGIPGGRSEGYGLRSVRRALTAVGGRLQIQTSRGQTRASVVLGAAE